MPNNHKLKFKALLFSIALVGLTYLLHFLSYQFVKIKVISEQKTNNFQGGDFDDGGSENYGYEDNGFENYGYEDNGFEDYGYEDNGFEDNEFEDNGF
jgi:hypothetical protein